MGDGAIPKGSNSPGDNSIQPTDQRNVVGTNSAGPSTAFQSQPQLPIDGFLDISLSGRLPHRGKDGRGPWFVDRHRSLERFGGEFAVRGGPFEVNGKLPIRNGFLDLSGNILNLTGLKFYDVGGGTVSGNLWSADGALFTAKRISLDENGVPRLYGSTLFGAPFDDKLRIVGNNPYVFPYGLNAGGELICHANNRDTVVTPFAASSSLRDNGLPSSWALTSMLGLGDEMKDVANTVSDAGILELYSMVFHQSTSDLEYARSELTNYQQTISQMDAASFRVFYGQLYELDDGRLSRIPDDFLNKAHAAFAKDLIFNAAPRGCRPDPSFDISNMPDWMKNDPLMLIDNARINGDFAFTDSHIRLPSLQGKPPVSVLLGGGVTKATVDVSYKNPELIAWKGGERDKATLANLRHEREFNAAIKTQFDIVSVKLGDKELRIPLSGNMDLTAQLKGLFPTRKPENLTAYIMMNGLVTLNGDIVVPALDGMPEIKIERGKGTNQVSAKNFSLTHKNGLITVGGELDAHFNFNKLQIGNITAPGPHNIDLSVKADEKAVVMELGGRMTLPRSGYPIPLQVALSRGYLELDKLKVVIDNPSSIDNVKGTFGGTIALKDLAGTVDSHPVTANAAVTIKDGRFTFKQGQIDADFKLGIDAKGTINNQGVDIQLQSDVGIHDSGVCQVDGTSLSWRHIGMQNVGGSIKANFNGIGIDAPKGSFGDGTVAEFDGQVISPGIHMKADVDGPRFGLFATTTINTQVKGVQIATPQGKFEISGQLVGTMKFVNISKDPKVPDFKPVVGSMRFELRNGQVAMIEGGSKLNVLNGATLEIKDNDQGVFSLIAHNRINLGGAMAKFGLGDIRKTLGLPGSVSNHLKISEIKIDPAGIHQHYPEMTPAVFGLANDPLLKIGPTGNEQWHQTNPPDFCPADPTTYSTQPVATYYDPGTIDTINIPSIILRATGGGTTLLSAHGGAKISGLTTDEPKAKYHLGTTLKGRKFKLPQGEVKVGSSYLYLSGVNEKVGLSLRPPREIKVDVKHTQDGITYEVKGTLKPKGRIHASVNLKGKSITIHKPKNPHSFSGDVEIVAKDSTGKIIGSGKVGLETKYKVSGTAGTARARFDISVPSTILSGELTHPVTTQGITIAKGLRFKIPITGFKGKISADFTNSNNPSMTSTWTLPSVGSGDSVPEVTIPGIQLAGLGEKGHLQDMTVNFHLNPKGQQVKVDASKTGGITFRALPGPSGKPRKIELSFAVDEKGNKVKIAGTSTSSALVSGNVLPNGEIKIDVSQLLVDSKTNGAVKQPVQLDLNGLNTLAKLPGLQVYFNPQTKKVRFVVKAAPYKMPAQPKSFQDFFKWTPQQWKKYYADVNKQQHLLRMSEPNVDALRKGAGLHIPAGKGDILVNLKKSIDITFPLDNQLASKVTAGLNAVLDIRRAQPAPPPCNKRCPAIILSHNQDPKGVLYFTETLDSKGQPRIHPDLPGLLEKGLGIKRDDVDKLLQDRRIGLPEVIDHVYKDKNVSRYFSKADIESLLKTYLTSPVPNGTFRQMALRSLVTLATIRKIGDLNKPHNKRLPVHGHVFGPDSYHSVSKGDGSNMQFLGVLPVDPAKLETIFKNPRLMGKWDHWVDQIKVTGNVVSGRLLRKYKFTVTTTTAREGNIRLIHFHLKPKKGDKMKAYTRTVRLVPVKNVKDPKTGRVIKQGTLVMMDEHADFEGRDTDLPFPRTRIPVKPKIAWKGFLEGTLRVVEPPTSNVSKHGMNRFAVSASNLLALAKGAKPALSYDSSRGSQSKTVRRVDFLTMGQNKSSQWVLKIDQNARSNDVQPYFKALGIPDAKINQWINKKELPLDDLRTLSGLDQYLDEASFRALAHATLNPSSSQFGSTTERYFVTLGHFKKRAKALQTRSGKQLKGDIIVFKDSRFHPKISQKSRRQGDTVDSLGFYYIPGTLNWRGTNMKLDIDKFTGTIHHAEDYARLDGGNFGSSKVIPHATLSDPSKSPSLAGSAKVDTNRVYTGSRIDLPGGLKLNYLISSPKAPAKVHGSRISAWKLEPSPQMNDFSDNTGYWLVIPAKQGGFFVLRAGILNSSSGSDSTGTVAETGRKGVVNFMEAIVTSALEYQRTGKRTAWKSSMGRVLDYQVGQVLNESGKPL